MRQFCRSALFAITIAFCSLPATIVQAETMATDHCGIISSVDALGNVKYVPWGKKKADTKTVATTADTSVIIALTAGKVADLKDGMWIKFEELTDGKSKKISAGQFLMEDGDKIVIFKGLPEEFILYNHEGWYTNEIAGVKFKIQPMGKGESPTNPGTNLRSAAYKEPAGGFVVYFPKSIEGAVVNWGGSKPGTNVPDADGKVLVNKETCTDYYWKHLKNPAKPDEGFTSGMTEFTIRKLPTRP